MRPKVFWFIFKFGIKIRLTPLNICDWMHDYKNWSQTVFLAYPSVTEQICIYHKCYYSCKDIIDVIDTQQNLGIKA